MPSSKTIWMTRWLVILGLCLTCSTLVSAQSTGGRILGRIADSSGAVLANVKITLTNEATGLSRETNSNASGDYSFVEVAPGGYRVEFEQTGFKKNVLKDVTVAVNSVVTLNSTLQIGKRKGLLSIAAIGGTN